MDPAGGSGATAITINMSSKNTWNNLYKKGIFRHVKELGTYNKLKENIKLSPYIQILAPMLENASKKTRKKVKTLGEGAYGRVNLESINSGNIAVKYFYPRKYSYYYDYIFEITTLRYTSGMPNITQLLGVTESDDTLPSIIMTKATTHLMDRSLYTSWNDTYSAILQILRGYYMLHNCGIAHRDVKLHNMLISDTGEVWLTDFGQARYITKSTPYDGLYGALGFASPESLLMYLNIINRNTPINWVAHDIWGIGVSLYIILTNSRPYTQDSTNIYEYDANRRKILTVLNSLFKNIGTPTEDDGILHKVYANTIKIKNVPKQSIYDKIMTNAVIRPDNITILETIAKIVERFLTFNPNKRMTIYSALEELDSIPLVKPKPMLYQEIVRLPEGYKDSINTLYRRIYVHNLNNMIILDRVCIYILKIMEYAKIHGNTEFADTKTVENAAFYIANTLFGIQSREIPIRILKQINHIMTYDIQFYGKTIYDELLEMEDTDYIKLGLFNLRCHQNNYYNKFNKNIDALKLIIKKYASMDISHISNMDDKYFTDFDAEVESKLNTTIGGKKHNKYKIGKYKTRKYKICSR